MLHFLAAPPDRGPTLDVYLPLMLGPLIIPEGQLILIELWEMGRGCTSMLLRMSVVELIDNVVLG